MSGKTQMIIEGNRVTLVTTGKKKTEMSFKKYMETPVGEHPVSTPRVVAHSTWTPGIPSHACEGCWSAGLRLGG